MALDSFSLEKKNFLRRKKNITKLKGTTTKSLCKGELTIEETKSKRNRAHMLHKIFLFFFFNFLLKFWGTKRKWKCFTLKKSQIGVRFYRQFVYVYVMFI